MYICQNATLLEIKCHSSYVHVVAAKYSIYSEVDLLPAANKHIMSQISSCHYHQIPIYMDEPDSLRNDVLSWDLSDSPLVDSFP